MSDSSSYASGLGVADLIGAAFVILKVIHVEPVNHWSWWTVTAPFWGQLVFLAVALVFIGIVAGVVALFD